MSVNDTTAKVQRILVDKFGSVEATKNSMFRIRYESAIGFVAVREWREDNTIVKVWSPMLRGVELTPEVFQWIATEGQNDYFAHARAIENPDDPSQGMIVWEHDLLGEFLDPDELLFTVVAILGGANEHDDELQARFGGRKGNDDS